jgi:hypothetical protein
MSLYSTTPMGSGRNDRSSLLDIRALSSAIEAQQRARRSASASSLSLPSFNRLWTMQDLLRSPAPKPEAQLPPTPVRRSRPHRLMYMMVAALSVVVAGLGAYVVVEDVAWAGATVTEDVAGERVAPIPEL